MILKNTFLKLLFIIILLCSNIFAEAQFTANTKQTFNSAASFIENIGQYGTSYKGQETMGEILYGFEGHDMPILFTKKGLIFLQRKVEKISKAEEEKLEKQGISEEEIEYKKIVTDRAITMEWVGANSNVEIIQEEKTYDYHTYGLIKEKAHGYKKITYKNLYNGIDLVYSFTNGEKIGFEYSLHVAAGANISQIKMQYEGDVKQIEINKQGNLIIDSDIEGIQQTKPITYYTNTTNEQQTNNNNQPTTTNQRKTQKEKQETWKELTTYNLTDNIVSFLFNESYDNTKPLIIDPFISTTSNLDGANAGKAKDIDFDYSGNVYVTGGGSTGTNHRLAKFDANGVLQWTFNGVLSAPLWEFGQTMGGWVVEKSSGNVYLGQGFVANGFRVIRLNSNGLYDNYISTVNTNFRENWKMIWNCNNGIPQILIGGGGTNSNINLGVLSPPSISVTALNLTGIPFISPSNGANQDIADLLIDPLNNNMYSIFASGPSIFLNNRIYCSSSPYSSSSILWNMPSGFSFALSTPALREANNRPYLISTNNNGNDVNDNSANIFSINANYLFYWDGSRLKAFNKVTGASVGTPYISNFVTPLLSGGIYADACNNVYIGAGTEGKIRVLNFNGTTFNDAPADITITGHGTKSVYDIAYNEADNLLYASGNGFIAAFDISATCPNNSSFNLNIVTNCSTSTATANLVPAAPTGSIVTYTLFIGNTQIATNSTGIFTGLLPLTNYKIIATINQACGGIRAIGNFVTTNGTSSPSPTVTTPVIYCQGANASALVAMGINLRWYTTAVGGIGTTAAPIPSTTTVGTTSHYVSQSNAGGTCESPRAQINVQVISALTAPIVTTPIIYCLGFTAPALSAVGTNLVWYTSATGGTGTAIAPIPSTATVGTIAYYVSQSNTGSTCESPRAQINVQVTTALASPTVTTPIIYCQGTTAIALTATGTNLLWYTAAAGGTGTSTAPIPSTSTVGTTAYYVSQSDAGGTCESPRTQINVQVVATTAILVAPIVTTPITSCQGATAIALTATGTNLLWYTTATGGVGIATSPIPNTTMVGSTAYYVSQSNAGGSCESPRAQISVNITPLLSVNAGNTITIAAGTTTQLNATATAGADYTWSSNIAPISLSNINILNPLANPLQTTTYLLTVKDVVGNCAAVSSSVQVVVIGTQNCINIRNAFTPNGDGINDIWLVYDRDFCLAKDGASVQVFNRYGSKVYENNAYKNNWDGTYNNKPLPDGTYYAVIVFTLVNGRKQYARNDVSIIR
jgi:gliding motility-associated-like protein